MISGGNLSFSISLFRLLVSERPYLTLWSNLEYDVGVMAAFKEGIRSNEGKGRAWNERTHHQTLG